LRISDVVTAISGRPVALTRRRMSFDPDARESAKMRVLLDGGLDRAAARRMMWERWSQA
jgi:hypothetical protein